MPVKPAPPSQQPPPSTTTDTPPKDEQIVSSHGSDSKEVWWVNGAFVIFTHVVGLAALAMYSPKKETYILMGIEVWLATMGITMGYHRLWSHRSFSASVPLRIILGFMGTLGFQGSIKWWVLRHRLHHRYTDDLDNDPYAAAKGFWFSHMGWIFGKPKYTRMKLIEKADLEADPIVRIQHAHYPIYALLSGFALPTLIASYFWSDALGGILYAGFVTRLIVWHCTFCINSFAHWTGEQEFSNETSARGNLILALLTQGEGYHNFHHEFPKDYRNGLHPLDYDPTKWLIYICSCLGLAWDLHKVPQNEIEKAKILTIESRILGKKRGLNWGPTDSSLKTYTFTQFQQTVSNENKEWIVIDDYVLDISAFKDEHPGGAKYLKNYVGKDATKAFYGNLNNHSRSARVYTGMLRVGRIEGGESLVPGMTRRVKQV
ncbi:hypothetical protein HDV05_000266 [Chytridiales sp. JEL 0842]|nr:hypothetical protein HDV05_000266 [Chytridiales sp. JEL 0842]